MTDYNTSEVWKDVPGYEGLYKVSSFGRILSLIRPGTRCRTERIRATSINRGGYERLSLTKNCKPRTIEVQILVANAFLGECPDGMEVNHKDGNKLNNRLDNLEYCTPKENIHHALKLGLANPYGENSSSAKLTNKVVLEIRQARAEGVHALTLASRYNVGRRCIDDVVKRRTWKHVA